MIKYETPILSEEGMLKAIEMLIDGKTEISRELKMSDYRAPIENNMTSYLETNYKLVYEIIRYYAESILKKCDLTDKSIPANIFDSELDNNLTIGDLEIIKNLSNEDMEQILNNEEEVLIKNNKLNHNIISFLKKYIRDNKGEVLDSTMLFKRKEECSKKEGIFRNRIYMNRNFLNSSSWEFLTIFIKKCIDEKIRFHLKATGATVSEGTLDKTVIYCLPSETNKTISLINQTLEEHPEFKQTLGSPITTGGSIINEDGNSYYSITRNRGQTKYWRYGPTFNDYINIIIRISFMISTLNCIKKYMPDKFEELPFKNIDTTKSNDEIISQLINITNLSYESPETYNKIVSLNKELSEKIGIEYKKELAKNMIKNIKTIHSYTTFGDGNHTDIPIFMDEQLYTTLNEKKIEGKIENKEEREFKEDLYLISIYGQFIENNFVSFAGTISKIYREILKEDLNIILKIQKYGTTSLTSEDLEFIKKHNIKDLLQQIVEKIISIKGPQSKKELDELIDKQNIKTIVSPEIKSIDTLSDIKLIYTYLYKGMLLSEIKQLSKEEIDILFEYGNINSISSIDDDKKKLLLDPKLQNDLKILKEKIITKYGNKAFEHLDRIKKELSSNSNPSLEDSNIY